MSKLLTKKEDITELFSDLSKEFGERIIEAGAKIDMDNNDSPALLMAGLMTLSRSMAGYAVMPAYMTGMLTIDNIRELMDTMKSDILNDAAKREVK